MGRPFNSSSHRAVNHVDRGLLTGYILLFQGSRIAREGGYEGGYDGARGYCNCCTIPTNDSKILPLLFNISIVIFACGWRDNCNVDHAVSRRQLRSNPCTFSVPRLEGGSALWGCSPPRYRFDYTRYIVHNLLHLQAHVVSGGGYRYDVLGNIRAGRGYSVPACLG